MQAFSADSLMARLEETGSGDSGRPMHKVPPCSMQPYTSGPMFEAIDKIQKAFQ